MLEGWPAKEGCRSGSVEVRESGKGLEGNGRNRKVEGQGRTAGLGPQ